MKNLPTANAYAVKFLFGLVSSYLFIVLSGCYTDQTLKNDFNANTGSNALAQSIDVQSPSYIFQTGDQLQITITGYREFDTTLTIGETGTISVRLLGEIQAAGISREQLTVNIKEGLFKYIKGEITPVITVINSIVQKVALFGAVAKQDNYNVHTEVTLLQLLTMAGGTAPEADLQHIRIFRGSNKTNFEEVDFLKYVTSGNITDMPTIKPGDTVYVPREENIIRELSSFFRDTIFLFTLFTISN